MVLADKATLVMNGRGVIHSVSQVFPLPSVIRLTRMIKRPRPIVKLTRKEIFRRDNYTCQYCGRQLRNLTVDHVVPRHLGGQTDWDNVVTACSRCNHLKGGMTPKQSGMYPRNKPMHPPQSATYLFGKHLQQYQEWREFLVGW